MVSPFLHPVGAAQEILRGEALEEDRGGGLVVDKIRQLHEPGRIHHAQLAIGAGRRAHIGDAIADAEFRDIRPDGLDHARGFHPDGERKSGPG